MESTPATPPLTGREAYHARRREQVNEKIYATAREVLQETGVVGFTVEAVAERSGVAKTTIYRRHSNALSLACGALGITEQVAEKCAIDILEFTRSMAAGNLKAEVVLAWALEISHG